MSRLISFLVLLSLLAISFPASASPDASLVVINEIDYDQAGTDTAEFIEIKNGTVATINLDSYSLVLVNGTGGGAAIYKTIDLPHVNLASGDYFVVCGNTTTVPNCDLDETTDTNLVQNGAPDAVALLNGTSIIDTVSYEGNTGFPYTEGSGVGLEDNPDAGALGISRCVDGTDTDLNNADFSSRSITPGSANSCGGVPGPFGVCGDPATPAHTIQGSGASSPEVGNVHMIEGVVVGNFQHTITGLGGFFLQEEDAQVDADPLTSEGIFVYTSTVPVEMGDLLRVQGTVDEYSNLTELADVIHLSVCSSGNPAPTPASITLPLAASNDWERWEGMSVVFTQTLYATENFYLGRYGEVELSVNARLSQPTDIVSPGVPALLVQDFNDRSRIQLDDGSMVQNPLPLPPYLALDNTLRLGDTLNGLSGVLSHSFGSYEIHPTVQAVSFTRQNQRMTTPPPLVGELIIAGANMLNFFTTLTSSGSICGPSGTLVCRGADNPAEFTRQRDKLLAALSAINADIFGLVELENNASASAQSLVDGLNTLLGAGTYAYINTGTIGTDAIKVGLLYKPARLTPVGAYSILDSSDDPNFLDTKNRPSLAQTFQDANGEKFTVVVNHFKSKGSSCSDVSDPDLGDGQGNCNLTRTRAATALASWLATDPTLSGDPDFLLLGDFNAYSMEDPVTALKNAGYANLAEEFIGDGVYSYVFDGQAGSLDHALASPGLLEQVSGVAVWHINPDEPVALNYNTEFNQPALYQPDAYRASDHDPVVIAFTPGVRYRLTLPLINR